MIHNMDEIGNGIAFPVSVVKKDPTKNGWVVVDGGNYALSKLLPHDEANFIADAINRFVGVACKEFVEDRLFGKVKNVHSR